MKIKPKYFLALIFLLTLGFRLFLVFNVPNFSDDTAYFHLRHINNIIDNKQLIFYDELSYGGRYVLQPPLFSLVMALLSFGNVFMLKLLPEVFFSFLVLIVYFIAKDISGDKYSSLFAALLSGFIPIFLINTMNVISPYSLALPLLFFMFYCLLKIEQKKFRNLFIVISFLLPFIHPISILFIIGLIFYFLLLSGGAVTVTKIRKEAILFASLTIILIQFMIYKKALLSYGLEIMWQNIPINILEDTYRQFSTRDLLLGVGLVPLVLGSIGAYLGINHKNKAVYLFSGFTLAVLLVLVFRLVTISIGLMIMGILLSIFSALTINKFIAYIKRLKLRGLNYLFILLLGFSFVIFSFIPSYTNLDYVSDEKLEDMNWLRENTNLGDTVLGNLHEGHLISSVANRKNVVDTNFLLAPNPIKRLNDAEQIYTIFTEAKALNIIRKYNIKIIYLSEETKDIYGIKDLNFVKGSKCFDWRNKFYVFKC